jgi:uncharacterized protein (UPF0128 family)
MTRKESQDKVDQESKGIQVDFAEGIDYRYRDVLNIFVGRGDVILELGNIHRSLPNNATIYDRVVISMANAYDFHARLGQALKEAQERLQKEMAQSR